MLRIDTTIPVYEPIRTCFVYGGGVMPGRRAGSGVGKYNAESPKQSSKRFNSITNTIHLAHLVILIIYVWVYSRTRLSMRTVILFVSLILAFPLF